MKKPVLVIMAAGMGSRFGGLKQIAPVDADGHIIMDFSIYDAACAGFEEVIFIIKEENETLFKEAIGNRIAKKMKVHYCYQQLDLLPAGFHVPEGREKPWGTAHAVLCAKEYLDGPFVVINADDYYGREAFALTYDFLMNHEDDEKFQYAMVGYRLENTVTEHGYVSRGVCSTDQDGKLVDIVERTRIEKQDSQIAYTEDEGKTYTQLPGETPVSMNMWAFTKSFVEAIAAGFPAFLEKGLKENPLKCEYYLPGVVDSLLKQEKAVVSVLPTRDKWYGITYQEDKAQVMAAIQKMEDDGLYKKELF
ncbi:nucleotidyltransferase [Lachnospiraceae bacterium OttesenSCG-928-J05]|nr:nucleotidyltransferase [Lachnospiraceae bacterium OttesenSCG-928-J05]